MYLLLWDANKEENVIKYKKSMFEEYDFILLFDSLEYLRVFLEIYKT